jgi:acetoacetyl-CoA synthetase
MNPLWTPTTEQIRDSNLMAFIDQVNQTYGIELRDYEELYQWSLKEVDKFWLATWHYTGVIAQFQGTTVIEHPENMEQSRFFPQARLNYAENLLRQTGDHDAIVFWGESKVRQRLSHDDLRQKVAQVASALRASGVKAGDHVAGFVPNSPESVIAMLASASIGAVWSSCSPDFGVQGVLDRFTQIEPKILFSADGYYYNGKVFDSTNKLKEIVEQLPSVEKTIIWPYAGGELPLDAIPHAMAWEKFIQDHHQADLQFESLPFNHPLFVMFSSGTTGKPKCIVHGAGGTLLEHIKEHQLHCDIKPGDRAFYFTTCGWMMWNWLVSALASGATLLLYDGSPIEPTGNILFDYADAESMTLFGASAKYIDALAKAGVKPIQTHNLSTVRMMTSTGSPLVPESFDYVYTSIKKDMCLASISGGTDIIGCFALGNPIAPVWRGELQTRSLGLAVDVYDDQGRPVRMEKGELICTAPFPSMPIGFWNDPNNEKYHNAYFNRFPHIWCHGDFVELTEHDGMIIYGRSDAVLNPGGIRIGTAEIYRQVEQIDEILESIAVGQDWDGDVRVILFVKLRPSVTLNEELVTRVKKIIRQNASPRHVPAKIIQVEDIPRTRSGKIVELAVREVIHNRPVKNQEALANPEALELYKNLPDLMTG